MASRTHTRHRHRVHRTVGLAGTAAVVASLLTVVGAPSAFGASEVYYAAPHGSGDCLAEEQACSLSEALDASAADAVIHLVADADGTTRFETTSGWDVDVDGVGSSTRTLTIEPAPGAEGPFTLDGASIAPYILWVHPGAVLSVTGVTVSNSFANAIFSGPLQGGGIHNELGDVTVTDVTFAGHRANASGSGVAYGGGIYNDAGTVTVQNSTFLGNSTNASGSASAYGGGIYNARGSTTVGSSTFSGDKASASDSGTARGGGIFNDHGIAGVENSAFSGAATTYSGTGTGMVRGGGIYSDNTGDAAGTRWLTVRRSTFSGNASGLTTDGSNAGVIASSFASNGRGIVLADGAATPAAIVSSTLVGNANGALVGAGSGTVLAGSLLADNGAANCAAPATPVHDSGYNLADDDSCWSEDASAATTRTVARADLALSGLTTNGGRTSTILPGAASIANGVIPANTPATGVIVDGEPVYLCDAAEGAGGTHDQRGVPRPLAAGGSCAVGAVEASLPGGSAGTSYAASLPIPDGLDGAVPEGATGVPSGLHFDTLTGTLTGVPTSAGSSEIAIVFAGGASTLPEEALGYRFTLAIGASTFGSGAGSGAGSAAVAVTDDETALPAGCDSAPFRDVTPKHPFCRAIAWLAAGRITMGYRDGTFRPAGDMSRAAAAAFLYRLAHRGASAPRCDVAPFRDVSVKNPFCGAIDWLMKSGITTGYSDGTFHPNRAASRAAAAAFLYRYAQADRPEPGVQADSVCSAAPFTDVPEHATFCTVIAWLKATGVTVGFSDRTFRPDRTISRGAFAAFLSRYAL